MIKLINGDCLEEMKQIEDGSIDMILCDLPYGTTACKWDTIIPFDKLWEQYNRIIKPNGAIVLFGSEPFTSLLITSNLKMFKYNWIWEKTNPKGYLNAKKQPLRAYETISIFYKKQCTYNPQGLIYGHFKNGRPNHEKKRNDSVYKKERIVCEPAKASNYPKNIIKFSNPNHKSLHPTQKPVELLEYLIKTYTVEGETVLDNCMGSGSTGVACVNTNRDFIGIELDKNYYGIAKKRIEEAKNEVN